MTDTNVYAQANAGDPNHNYTVVTVDDFKHQNTYPSSSLLGSNFTLKPAKTGL